MASTANAASYFVDRHLAEGRADKIAFIEGERSLTYGALATQTDQMVGLLAIIFFPQIALWLPGVIYGN